MPLTNYFEVGHSFTFKVSTDQCKYQLVVDYIDSSMSPGTLYVCSGETTPIRITYTGTGGTHNVMGKDIGDHPECQHIASWVSGIIAPDPVCK